jgi:hypothetical protein
MSEPRQARLIVWTPAELHEKLARLYEEKRLLESQRELQDVLDEIEETRFLLGPETRY